MTTLPLIGDISPLANGVRRGQLKRITSDFSAYGCSTITVWLTSGEGFRLTSQMHDAAGIEVGILKLELVLHPVPDETSVDLPWPFRNGGSISKLIIQQREVRAESGLLLRSRDGDEIIILPATSPHRLYVAGVDTPAKQALPEYSLSRYMEEAI